MREKIAEKVLMRGTEAIGEGAILAGCEAYFSYPITPQNELLEYMARRMPELGRVFLQTESEIAAISMVLGAAASGHRVMSSTSSPGFSLQQEGISYLAGDELPAVLVNIMRVGPGLGGILAAQGDYFQATKGGGHGDYHLITLAPASAQEAMDLTMLAFDLADRYRNPTLILADALVGQAMEPVEMHPPSPPPPPKPWAIIGARDRLHNIIRSLRLDPDEMEAHLKKLSAKYAAIETAEVRWQGYRLEDARVVIVAYGSVARSALTAVDLARQEGVSAGLFRPISLYPFPYQALKNTPAKGYVVAELSMGQLIEDVRLALGEAPLILPKQRLGGTPLTPEELMEEALMIAGDLGLRR